MSHSTHGARAGGASGEAFVTSYRAHLTPGFRARRHHIVFYELLSSVELALAEAQTPHGWKHLLSTLEELDKACAAHMKTEEDSGMFEKLRDALPVDRAGIVNELEREHEGLLAELSAIHEAVRVEPDVCHTDRPLTARIGAWLTSMYMHEDRELDLLKAAFNVD